MTYPRCATCAHWYDGEGGALRYEKVGVRMRRCELLSFDTVTAVDTTWEEEMGTGSGAEVCTAETFGCVLHEERKP